MVFDANLKADEKVEIAEGPALRTRRDPNEPGDAELVADYRRAFERFGPRSEAASLAFEPIFRRFWPQLLRLAESKMGQLYAEDLAGETMQTVLERLNGKEIVTNLKGLVRHSFEREYATLLEKLFQGRKLLRAQQSAGTGQSEEENNRVKGAVIVSLNAPVGGSEMEEVELMQTLDDPEADVVEAAARRELVRVLRSLIEEMPANYRAPLICQWLLGMRIKEVADELNLTE